jgi:hypothetical protein
VGLALLFAALCNLDWLLRYPSSISLGIAALNPDYGGGQFVAQVERSDTWGDWIVLLHHSRRRSNLRQYFAST